MPTSTLRYCKTNCRKGFQQERIYTYILCILYAMPEANMLHFEISLFYCIFLQSPFLKIYTTKYLPNGPTQRRRCLNYCKQYCTVYSMFLFFISINFVHAQPCPNLHHVRIIRRIPEDTEYGYCKCDTSKRAFLLLFVVGSFDTKVQFDHFLFFLQIGKIRKLDNNVILHLARHLFYSILCSNLAKSTAASVNASSG